MAVLAVPCSVASAQQAPGPDAAAEEPRLEFIPAVVLEPGAEAASESAGAFRCLVPTLVTPAAVLLAVMLHYGFRSRGRHRVVR